MIKYWFEFEEDDVPFGIQIGCGVTAYNYEDAIFLLKSKIFKNRSIPNISKLEENVDVTTLDRNHVLPNMAAPSIRGIWFPLGYNF